VPRASSTLGDVVGEDAGANVFARLAALWIARDCDERFLDQARVFASLRDSPALLRVLDDLDDVALRGG
jgi:hypothetical protein